MKLSDIRPNDQNPRTISEAKMKSLVKSITDFEKMLLLRPIIVDADGVILGGNMRYQALKQMGRTEIPDEWVKRASDLTDDEKREFIIKDNVGFGEWDWDALANDWNPEQLTGWGLEIPDWTEQQGEAQEDDFEMPDEVQTDIVPGDLIEIGRHRLLCGDSTNVDDVKKLLEGKEPRLMVTDPPYGVEYDPNWRNEASESGHLSYGDRAIGKVQNDGRADWTETWSLSPCDVAYVWHADRHAKTVQESLEKCRFEVRNQIIWAKTAFAISRGNYHWQHEPCWYAVKKGKKSYWVGDRSQSTLWKIDHRKSETGHGTQKPIEAMARPIGNHDGDVYDPFLGSGTTMVAAHQLNRTCYGMEIDPKYCQVIIDRMVKLDPAIEVKINGKAYVERKKDATD